MKQHTFSKWHMMLGIQINDILLFGTYYLPGSTYPNNAKVKSSIAWQVIDRDGDKIMLLSQHSLYWNFYDGNTTFFGPPPETCWEKSTIREELNSECLESWFSISEQSIITEHEQVIDENPMFQTPSGSGTIDRLFLLSLEEANRYLDIYSENMNALKQKTNREACAYMLMADLSRDDKGGKEIKLFRDYAPWWLRTAGEDIQHVACIDRDGSVDYEGIEASADEVGIRPAMWIDLGRLQNVVEENDR